MSKLFFFWQPGPRGQAPASVGREMTLWLFCFAAAAGGLTTVGAWPEQLCECAGTMEVLGVLRHQCKTTNNSLLNRSPRQRLHCAAEVLAGPGITNTSSTRFLERVAEPHRKERRKPGTACTWRAPSCRESLAKMSKLKSPGVHNGARHEMQFCKANGRS